MNFTKKLNSAPVLTVAYILLLAGCYFLGGIEGVIAANIILPVTYSTKAGKLDRVRQAFRDVPNALITESYLQKEVATSATANNYVFNFNGTPNDIAFTTENLLDKNNVFVVTDIWFGLGYEPASTSDYATEYFTWPNFPVLETTGGATQIDLEVFWNGWYEIKTGLMTIPRKSCRDHYFAPTTDQVIHAAGGTAAASVRAGQIQGSSTGFVGQEPMVILSGSASQEFNLTVNTGYVADITCSTGQLRVVFRLAGFLCFNAALADWTPIIEKNKGVINF